MMIILRGMSMIHYGEVHPGMTLIITTIRSGVSISDRIVDIIHGIMPDFTMIHGIPMIHGTGTWVFITDTVIRHIIIILSGGIAIMVDTTVIIRVEEAVTGVIMIPIRAQENSGRTGLQTLEFNLAVTAIIIPKKWLRLQKPDQHPV